MHRQSEFNQQWTGQLRRKYYAETVILCPIICNKTITSESESKKKYYGYIENPSYNHDIIMLDCGNPTLW